MSWVIVIGTLILYKKYLSSYPKDAIIYQPRIPYVSASDALTSIDRRSDTKITYDGNAYLSLPKYTLNFSNGTKTPIYQPRHLPQLSNATN